MEKMTATKTTELMKDCNIIDKKRYNDIKKYHFQQFSFVNDNLHLICYSVNFLEKTFLVTMENDHTILKQWHGNLQFKEVQNEIL